MPRSSKLRDLILNTNVPLVIHDFPLGWECFQGSLQDWCTLFDSKANGPPDIQVMQILDSHTPQWERKRKRSQVPDMQTFLRTFDKKDEEQTHWAAFHYKRSHEVPPDCRRGIDFAGFGFPDHDNDYTLWLGSEQSNTPCHYDTFGVNIVVQVYGSKSWLLFPPETPLESTRIPYEESSVYSMENFYAPATDLSSHYRALGKFAYHCILQPGDVLIVPRHWWHYVEARSMALSVNYWVPLNMDKDLALDEFLVKHIVESALKGEGECMKEHLLNPNQLDEVASAPSALFERMVEGMENAENIRRLWDSNYLTPSECDNLRESINLTIRPLGMMPKEEYQLLLNRNNRRYENCTTPGVPENPISPGWELILSSLCAPHVITTIKREFFRRLRTGRV
ncbi:hypothetical protein KR018_007980 [Drosophila ironensis]|nr:hypothetical protein KR018_007980 [Drosophila ironensis]